MANVRLYVDHPLAQGQSVTLAAAQAHYLFGVMRLTVGDRVLVFNGRDGEWAADIQRAGKRNGDLVLTDQTAPLRLPADLWLLFAPVKKARTDFIVEKAVEMGVSQILPVQTEFTNSERIRRDRLQAHAVEAAEQCGATFVPQVHELQKLKDVLAQWDPARSLMFCDETRAGTSSALAGRLGAPMAILIGPEGGFSASERDALAEPAFVHGMSLGPRILRAETAAVAAITLWQAQFGDWR